VPIRQETCYVAHCNTCGEEYENGDGVIYHMPTPELAREEAENCDWRFWKDKCWCEFHVPPCRCGHLLGNHDYGESPCQECGCQEYDPVEPEGRKEEA